MKLNAVQSPLWRDEKAPTTVQTERVYIGHDPLGLGGIQIAVASASAQPTRDTLAGLYKRRRGQKQIALIVAVTHQEKTYLFGPEENDPTVIFPEAQAQRCLQALVEESDVLGALRRYTTTKAEIASTQMPGVVNNGLFATHHIRENVPQRSDWAELQDAARSLLTQRELPLIRALGFHPTQSVGGTYVLSSSSGQTHAIALLMDESEGFDETSIRFQLSPVAFGLGVAARQNLPWLIVLRKDQIRLYSARDGVGVGQKGQTETFFQIDLATVDDSYSALLPLVFSEEALSQGRTEELIEESARYASALSNRLRERIYLDVIPPLAEYLASQLPSLGLATDQEGLDTAYRLTIRILFRWLFQAYAEDRQLLPAGRNDYFDKHSLKSFAQQHIHNEASSFSQSTASLWDGLRSVWEAIDQGNPQWSIPPYNGGLFASDPQRSPDGALINSLVLPDSIVGPALKSLLLDTCEDGVLAPVDFRSLGVREFGTVYEGLLESSLSVADTDLTVDDKNMWIPASPGDQVLAPAGSAYFHTSSGERKATGSFFTQKIFVDHLIERTLKPTLQEHLKKIERYLADNETARAAAEFFDFRVADLAMGSGHFLVAAVDKIESLMRDFLTEHNVEGVRAELIRLAAVAKDILGDDHIAKDQVDEIALLRRQVARRCIYGVDINPMSVELARLAMWIHTFVPGLPMSNLDHGLVCANTLTGIGTVDEAVEALVVSKVKKKKPETTVSDDDSFDLELSSAATYSESGYERMVRHSITSELSYSLPILIDAANASEATKAEVQINTDRLREVQTAVEPVRRIFDAALAVRLKKWSYEITRPEHVSRLSESNEHSRLVEHLNPAHMPILFPEVFVRENPGFDVLVGNPPWEELKVEERSFWLRYRPGLYGLKDAERVSEIKRLRNERPDLVVAFNEEKTAIEDYVAALRYGPFPGIGTGDPELAKAFAWRNWDLTRQGGAIGLVLPRTLLNSAGGEEWRRTIFSSSDSNIHILLNNKRWAFDIHPQFGIALLSIRKSGIHGTVSVAGPLRSRDEFLANTSKCTLTFETILAANSAASIPNISDRQSAEVFTQICRSPKLNDRRPGWDYRPVREFDATNDRKYYDAGGFVEGRIPVWGGEGFNIWVSETGEVKAWADPEVAESALQTKRLNQLRLKKSAFYGESPDWADDPTTLPFHHPRIAFRSISRSTDTRTIIAALIPNDTLLQNSAPYFFRKDGNAQTDAWLLAFLSSLPLDWYARTIVETNVNFFIINSLPIPVLVPDSSRHQRIVQIAGRLAATDERYALWAQEVNVAVCSVKTEAEKEDLVAELDALVALVYGLTREQLTHVFSTFHVAWDYQRYLTSTLKHYDLWKTKQ